jgi:hypothetical protein
MIAESGPVACLQYRERRIGSWRRNVQLSVSSNAAGAGGDYDGGAKFKT